MGLDFSLQKTVYYINKLKSCRFVHRRTPSGKNILSTAFIVILWLPACTVADKLPLAVNITDTAPYHVHPPGQPFQLCVEIKGQAGATVTYHWEDFRGNVLSQPEMLSAGKPVTLTSPASYTGYYELVIKPESTQYTLPNRQPGEARGYGFIIAPSTVTTTRHSSPESPFGVVHADIEDPWLPAWAKTLTWNTTGDEWWAYEINKRRSAGILELPLIAGEGWDSNDRIPIPSSQLDRLKRRAKSYFSTSPTTLFWETGIEENLDNRYRQSYYWRNLESKLQAVRAAADQVNPDIRLIYQIAGLDQQAVTSFAKSRASRWVDILSLHPYAWPDFPSPETWHDKFIHQVREQLESYQLKMPVWYTEVGAAQQGNIPGGFFGYPEENNAVTGLTPYQAMLYLIKLHILALQAGIEKIFWYNYQDRHAGREYAENHFGLRDYQGYPRPMYAAYLFLNRLLTDKNADGVRKLPGNIFSYQFSDKQTRIQVVWAFPASTANISIALTTLLPDYSPDQTVKVINSVGRMMPNTGKTIPIAGEPIYIISKR